MTHALNDVQICIEKKIMSGQQHTGRQKSQAHALQSTGSNRVGLIDTHAKLIELDLRGFTWSGAQKSTALSVLEMH